MMTVARGFVPLLVDQVILCKLINFKKTLYNY